MNGTCGCASRATELCMTGWWQLEYSTHFELASVTQTHPAIIMESFVLSTAPCGPRCLHNSSNCIVSRIRCIQLHLLSEVTCLHPSRTYSSGPRAYRVVMACLRVCDVVLIYYLIVSADFSSEIRQGLEPLSSQDDGYNHITLSVRCITTEARMDKIPKDDPAA